MRAVIQRVSCSKVLVENKVVGEIKQGLNVLLGVEEGDTDDDLQYIVNKVSGLRIFSDKDGKMNLSIKDIQGQILLISQFTLCGDARKGKRPSFTSAEKPDLANRMYIKCAKLLADEGLLVETGQFQEDMDVIIHNQGPVTILLDSKKKF